LKAGEDVEGVAELVGLTRTELDGIPEALSDVFSSPPPVPCVLDTVLTEPGSDVVISTPDTDVVAIDPGTELVTREPEVEIVTTDPEKEVVTSEPDTEVVMGVTG
jgi:hypothetical protein